MNRTTIEISAETRTMLKGYCVANSMTYEEALQSLLSTSVVLKTEGTKKLLDFYCEISKITPDEAITKLLKKELKNVTIIHKITDDGNMYTVINDEKVDDSNRLDRYM